MTFQGPFDLPGDWEPAVSNDGERYLPLVTRYDPAMHLGHMACYREALKYAYGRKVLDIGCGVGYGSFFLASFGAERITAMDFSLDALGYARQVYAHPHLEFLQADGMRLPFADQAFDFVFSSQVIEHVTAVDVFLSEIKRVLTPNGFCLIITPNKAVFSPVEAVQNPHHISEMDLPTFQAQMQRAFGQIQMKGIPQRLMRWDAAGQSLVWKPANEVSPADFQVQEQDLEHCENLMGYGRVQAGGEFISLLPANLQPVCAEPAPFFWDAAQPGWSVMGLCPDAAAAGALSLRRGQLVQEFVSPRPGLYRLQVALASPTPAPLRARLLDMQDSGRPVSETRLSAGQTQLDWVFPAQPASRGRRYALVIDRPLTAAALIHLTELSRFAALAANEGERARTNGILQHARLDLRTFHLDLPSA